MDDTMGDGDMDSGERLLQTILTSGTLTSLLRDAGLLDHSARVVSWSLTPTGGSGHFGRLDRVALAYEPPDAPGPPTLIVKSSIPHDTLDRALGATEARFYQDEIPEHCSLGAPRAYSCAVDEVSGEVVLILEDLGDGGFVRQIDGCSRDEAMAAMREIAKLHARWWGQPLPAELCWIRPPAQSPVGDLCRRWIGSYTGPWPETLGAAPLVVRERFDELVARLASGARAVVHGDFHSGNISFERETGAPRLVDFQFVQHASGMVDVARFLATSLTIEARRSLEHDLLGEYERSLRALGVAGYDVAADAGLLRTALLWNLATPLTLHLMNVSIRGVPWPARFPILERCLAAIDDWRALDPVADR